VKRELSQDRAVQRCGDAMALIACAALETARFDAHGLNLAALAVTLCALASVWLARWQMNRLRNRGDERAMVVACIVTGILVLPSVVEWMLQAWFGLGQAREFHLCVLLRNLMLAITATAQSRWHRQLIGLLSLFLIVFVSSQANDPWSWLLAFAYGIVGVVWLAMFYWSGLADHFAERTTSRVPVVFSSRRLAMTTTAAFAIVTLLSIPILTGATLFGVNTTTAIAGWFSTSGGTDDCDPFARAGVNDGDALVRGTDNAESFGPIESDVFLNTDEPSLYDVFNDMYGEPKKIKQMERAIGLAPSFNKSGEEQKWAENRKLSREFSTVRSRPRRKDGKKLQDTNSPALLYVAGRTPLHLRVEVFDAFDGTTWTCGHDPAELLRKSSLTVRNEHGKPWIHTGLLAAFRQSPDDEAHVVKVIRLDTNHIPAPARLGKLHIDKIDRADFFAWADGDIVQMTREKVPSCTVIRMVSQTPSREQLGTLPQPIPAASLPVPQNPRTDLVSRLAKEWAGDAERGWSQVEVIASRLREHCEYAPDEVLPEECRDSVAHFLLNSRRGPDYLFASAAAVLLRHLGYSTRVVSGFYASPGSFDSRSRHTPVLPSDVHFWTEVELGSGVWATVEATPGYATLEPPVGIAQQCLLAICAAGRWCYQHIIGLIACVLVLAGVVYCRRLLCDVVLQVWWNIASRRSVDSCVRATVRLIEHRFRWAGRSRPTHVSPVRWYTQTTIDHTDANLMRRLAAMLEWSLYAPMSVKSQQSNWSQQAFRETCLWAIHHWSVRRCRANVNIPYTCKKS
jgi:protein-glutamine gamma-glutamyltransferase